MKIENEILLNLKEAVNNITTDDNGKLNKRLSMLSKSYTAIIEIASSIIGDIEESEFTEIEDEKILNLQRAGFDVWIRNCSMIDAMIFESCNKDEIKHYIEFRAASILVYLNRNIPNPTGQCGLDTKFADGVKEFLKNRKESD